MSRCSAASRVLAHIQGVDAVIPRVVVALLAATLIGLPACTGRRETSPAQAPPPAPEAFKIGIMTGSASRAGEDFRAATEVAHRYPHRVMHITFPDNFPSESVTVVAQLTGLAGESKVRAIVIGQAITGSVAATRAIRTLRPDVIVGFVTPHEDPDSVAGVCDLAIGPDETARASGIVAAARSMGARNLVHYSFPRDLARPLLARQRELLRTESARRGMRFQPVTSPDPAGNEGPEAARDFVSKDVPRQFQRLGPATAFYATSDAMQEPLIRTLLALRTGYLVEQALPAPTAGYPAALDVQVASAPASVPDSLHDALRRRIAAAGMSGHFGTWTASVEGVAIRAMAALMMDAVEGRADLHDSTTVARYLAAEARGPVRMRRSRPGADQWMILLDRVTY